MRNRGFTLIEILVAAGIYGVIGMLVLSIIFIAVRGSKTSDLLAIVQQSGSSTLSQLERQMRYAKSLDYPASCVTPVTGATITVTELDNTQKIFSCVPSDITLNGDSLVDSAVTVGACSFSCSQRTISDPPVIDIRFSLVTRDSNVFTGSRVAIPFQTKVIMRNAVK